MFTNTYYMKTQDLLERGLNNATFKRKVLADNIANVDVPNFKRSEVSFEANLKRALESEDFQKEMQFLPRYLMKNILNFSNL